MSGEHVDVEEVLGELKEFQQRTARWAFRRMFAEENPAHRFLVADEVGLGKTHVAKGVIAQVIDHLGEIGDERHDIVYVCSNQAIASQNVRKLAPAGIEPLKYIGRLTMLPLAKLNEGDGKNAGVNLIAITPGTSLDFGRNTGRFNERCLAYAFLRKHWGPEVMGPRAARRIFWEGLTKGDPDRRLQDKEREYRPQISVSLKAAFADELAEVDESRRCRGQPTLRSVFDRLVEGLKWRRSFPRELKDDHKNLIVEVRTVMATVGIAALKPDLVVLDEFQRFKQLLSTDPDTSAAELAHQLFGYVDRAGRRTRTLLLSATPYRMYTTADEIEGDHYQDFLHTCRFLFQDDERTDRLGRRFADLRSALTSAETLPEAEPICAEIGSDLRDVMARSERLAATPRRDGMLSDTEYAVTTTADDLRAYLRFGNLADRVEHHEPTEYWKSAPYLVNFMDDYKLKEHVKEAVEEGKLTDDGAFEPGPGLLSWDDLEEYSRIDPQNGRLRWLLNDLEQHRAFELLWVPPSLRYYDTGSVYETPEARNFTKRLVFSGWKVVPKVVSALVSLEAERRAFAGRNHNYTADWRGGSRLDFRMSEGTVETRAGEAGSARRAASMTTFLLVWPSPSLAELGDPRSLAVGGPRHVSDVLAKVEARVAEAIAPLVRSAPETGPVDQRWYWATPLLLDDQQHPEAVSVLLGDGSGWWWQDDNGDLPGGFRAHLDEAKEMLETYRKESDDASGLAAGGAEVLGRPPADLAEVLAGLALGGPAQCALRAVSSTIELRVSEKHTVGNAARIAEAFRRFFNAPEVTGVIVGGRSGESDSEHATVRYWRDVVRHSIYGNLQSVLDEHCHVLRDWLSHPNLSNDEQRADAARDIGCKIGGALRLRSSQYRVDIPVRSNEDHRFCFEPHRMRTRFAVPYGTQRLDDDSGQQRVGFVSGAFNSPFWPFVLTSTSVGQEGLDFHLWCHAVVHWNLPTNPVDLEQREGRVHRYKGHAVRRNLAAKLGGDLLTDGVPTGRDLWDILFDKAVELSPESHGAIVPYWVFKDGPAKIQRHVPVLPFSRDEVTVSRLRKSLAAYRLAFGQPRQEELIEFLGADRTDEELRQLTSRLKIDLSPPAGA
ncbi:MAG: hypothetical protein F4Z58_01650 [Acidimicrobiaceae bacterium]|nr:hypothetical protein [Acidimicrobiaceae bacterium]MYD07962.1 hypothetical protein [Acidimicrobiaceae bacterium]MYI58424.1 hypothetical protein [Acidimicrobiaceae bacterium]